MSERPDWELFYHNIFSLLDYVQKENTPSEFNLLWNSNYLHQSIVDMELPDDRKFHEERFREEILEDYALKAYWEKYYNPALYNNGLPPYPYEIDVYLAWKKYGGDRSTNGIMLLPSDTYEIVVERVLKKFSYMISYYLRQDWFCKCTRDYKTWGIAKIERLHRYKEWQERIRTT